MRHEPEPKPLRRVVVYQRTAHEAFGRLEETGEQVYIPCRVAFSSGLKADTTVLAAVIPNHSGIQRTPWFATYVDARSAEPTEVVSERFLEDLRAFLDEGGAWPVEDVSTEMVWPVLDVELTLERLYARGECHKFVLFRADQPRGLRVWYSRHPDRCDVAEFEE